MRDKDSTVIDTVGIGAEELGEEGKIGIGSWIDKGSQKTRVV